MAPTSEMRPPDLHDERTKRAFRRPAVVNNSFTCKSRLDFLTIGSRPGRRPPGRRGRRPLTPDRPGPHLPGPVAPGRPRGRVVIFDDDQGKTAWTAARRGG